MRVAIVPFGSVGIGTTVPGAKLQIEAASVGYGEVRIKSTGTSSTIGHYSADGGWDAGVGSWNNPDKFVIGKYNPGGGAKLVIDSSGNVGIGTTSPSYTLHVNGSIAGVGAYNALSDIRYKKDVQDLAGSLAKVLAIRGVSYKWIDEEKYGSGTQLGVIAQEIERIVPEVVTTGSDGVKRVKYDDLIPLIIEAMKAERAEKDAEIAALKAEAAQLKAAMCSKFPELPLCSH